MYNKDASTSGYVCISIDTQRQTLQHKSDYSKTIMVVVFDSTFKLAIRRKTHISIRHIAYGYIYIYIYIL